MDPIDKLAGTRPSYIEHAQRGLVPDLELPFAQAQRVALVNFTGQVGILAMACISALSIYAVVFLGGLLNLLGWIGFVVVILGVLWYRAATPPFASFNATTLREIDNPLWNAQWEDLDRESLRAMVLDILAQQRASHPPSSIVRLEVNNGGGQWRFSDLPAPSPKSLIWFARDVLNDLTEGSFCERTANHHGFSRVQWQDLRDRMLEMQAVRWKHPDEPRQGLLLTDLGEQVLSEIARTPLAEVRR